MSKKYIYLSFIALFFLFSCKDEKKKPFEKCKYGAPIPIFKEGNEKEIASRNFTMTKESSYENITFSDGTELQVVQSGCNEIIQEFTFYYKPDVKISSDEEWKKQAIDEFLKISNLDPKYIPFKSWAKAIGLAAPDMRLGQATELEKDFFVTIDKVQDGQKIQLIVKLNAKN
jgi:hypothetical protein